MFTAAKTTVEHPQKDFFLPQEFEQGKACGVSFPSLTCNIDSGALRGFEATRSSRLKVRMIERWLKRFRGSTSASLGAFNR